MTPEETVLLGQILLSQHEINDGISKCLKDQLKINNQVMQGFDLLTGRIKVLADALEDASDEIDVLKRQVAALESAAQT